VCRKALGGGWGEICAGILPCPCQTRMKSAISLPPLTSLFPLYPSQKEVKKSSFYVFLRVMKVYGRMEV